MVARLGSGMAIALKVVPSVVVRVEGESPAVALTHCGAEYPLPEAWWSTCCTVEAP